MKKNVYLVLFTIVAAGVMFVSCTGASAPKTSLKNVEDSVSYAYGVNLAEQGLKQFLEQSGVIASSSAIQYQYQSKISAETDSVKKEALIKEQKKKIDSLNNANAPKLNEFIRGLKQALNNSKDKAPYYQGLSVGMQLSEHMMPQFKSAVFGEDSTKDINKEQMLAGLIGILKNSALAIPATDADGIIQRELDATRQKHEQKVEAELRVQYKDSIAAGEAFLAENAKRSEVVTLPSGLQYEILKKGNGPVPTDNDRVKVHYRGTLLNGTEFDSSYKRKEPAVFGINNVIKGWTEALKLMPVGSKWKLYIPYELAYGSKQQGDITPFSTLLFEVELLGIEK